MSTTKHSSQDHESKSRWISAKTRYCLILVLECFIIFFLALQVSEHPPPSHFHLVSIPFQWLSWKGAQARHLSNSTKVSQVSNTTGTPLGSILFHRFEAWSPRPPCQAPGLGSFIVNFVVPQVDVRHRLVDFQCFGKGLWTKPMAHHVKPENLQGDLRH